MKEENAKTITRFKNKNNIMEITVNILKNDYVQPTEVRQEVVQYICDAFLSTCVWRIFHPERQSAYRGKTLYVMVSKRTTDLVATQHLTVTLIFDLMARK